MHVPGTTTRRSMQAQYDSFRTTEFLWPSQASDVLDHIWNIFTNVLGFRTFYRVLSSTSGLTLVFSLWQKVHCCNSGVMPLELLLFSLVNLYQLMADIQSNLRTCLIVTWIALVTFQFIAPNHHWLISEQVTTEGEINCLGFGFRGILTTQTRFSLLGEDSRRVACTHWPHHCLWPQCLTHSIGL